MDDFSVRKCGVIESRQSWIRQQARKEREEYIVKDPFKSAKKKKGQTMKKNVQIESKPVKKNGTKQGLKTWLSQNPPSFLIKNKKYIFKNIMIKHCGDRYTLVLPCDETIWALKKTKDEMINICAYQDRKGLDVQQKDSPFYGVYNSFLDLTRGVPFSILMEVAKGLFPSRNALEYEGYLVHTASYLKKKAFLAAKNAAKENSEQ